MRRMLRPTRLGIAGTCLLLVVGVVAAPSAAGAGTAGTAGAAARPWVADVLFGRRPFTGRLSMTWPRSLEQEPINVGDRHYDPLFPYGYGLRT